MKREDRVRRGGEIYAVLAMGFDGVDGVDFQRQNLYLDLHSRIILLRLLLSSLHRPFAAYLLFPSFLPLPSSRSSHSSFREYEDQVFECIVSLSPKVLGKHGQLWRRRKRLAYFTFHAPSPPVSRISAPLTEYIYMHVHHPCTEIALTSFI